jgi:septal ring factor EnvC (AmiA/AmiB activator)
MPSFLRIALLTLGMTSVALAQSLGDVARENREKASDSQTATATKVVTNSDLAADTDAGAEPASSNTAQEQRANQNAIRRSARQRAAEQRTANQWKQQILAQKSRIASLQEQIDELKSAMTASYGTVQYEAPYSRAQARSLQRLSQLQRQMEGQRARLADMQEAARRAGMHTPVYDP